MWKLDASSTLEMLVFAAVAAADANDLAVTPFAQNTSHAHAATPKYSCRRLEFELEYGCEIISGEWDG